MHTYILPLLATALGFAAAQDGRTLVTNFSQVIGVSSGGLGGASGCQIQGTLDRGGEVVSFAVQRPCGDFQDNGSDYFEFDNAPGLKLLVSCDVRKNHCGTFYDLRVETDDGYCNQGRLFTVDCPETDFKKKRAAGVHDARQEPPIQTTKQCYGDILLVECFD